MSGSDAPVTRFVSYLILVSDAAYCPINITKMRFTFVSKVMLCVMFAVVVITVIKIISQQTNIRSLYKSYAKLKKPGMKYILLWTSQENIPFVHMGLGQSGFIERKCPFTNCIVTDNQSLLNSYLDFDVIAFAGPELVRVDKTSLPPLRLPYQKYVFASIESPNNYPLCPNIFDGYFNWTWTYKLDSDIRWGYIVIRDMQNNIIGPKKDMHWLNQYEMAPVNETFKKKLMTKKKAAVWFVSNCHSKSRREGFMRNLRRELQKYNLKIDVYGKCGLLVCPRKRQDKCNRLIRRDYYFYLSFENAFSEDYVTEKVLTPLQNNAVPIVYGGANYTRFLPDGSYLNAKELGIYELAEKMNELIQNPDMYAEYFRWKNHYTFHKTIDSVETNEYCKMCAALNDEELVKKKSVHTDFSDWWESYDEEC